MAKQKTIGWGTYVNSKKENENKGIVKINFRKSDLISIPENEKGYIKITLFRNGFQDANYDWYAVEDTWKPDPNYRKAEVVNSGVDFDTPLNPSDF